MTTRVSDRDPLTFSVVICTRDRLAQLESCLVGISRQSLKPLEVLIVDNAPLHGNAKEIASRYGARYIFEPRLGASCARNRGARGAIGDVIAYIDDDGHADADWLSSLSTTFQDEQIMAAGGRTIPPESTAEIMRLCRRVQGVGEGKRSFLLDRNSPGWFPIVAFGGICASGTNMAFRRSVFKQWPGFDLRIGLPHSGCEDHFAFVSLIDAGFKAAYVPEAVVTHPTEYTVEGLRSRYLKNCAHATAYILFLMFHLPQHRRELINFVLGGLRGVRREWRQESSREVFDIGIPVRKIFWARCQGAWMYIRALSASGG